jgi:hypothetical protein
MREVNVKKNGHVPTKLLSTETDQPSVPKSVQQQQPKKKTRHVKPYDDEEPWAQREDESGRAYEGFVQYRDYEGGRATRSLMKVARKHTRSKAQLQEWSTKYDWVKRVEAWDREQDRIKYEARREEIEKMEKRHAQVALEVLAKAIEGLKSVTGEGLSPRDVLQWLGEAVRIERLSRGASTENVMQELVGGRGGSAIEIYTFDEYAAAAAVAAITGGSAGDRQAPGEAKVLSNGTPLGEDGDGW